MSSQVRQSEIGGRSTRSRAKQLGISIGDISISQNEKPESKRRKTGAGTNVSKEHRKGDDSSVMLLSSDEMRNSFNESKKKISRKTVRRTNKSTKVDSSHGIDSSHIKSPVLSDSKIPLDQPTVLLPKIDLKNAVKETPQTSPIMVNLTPKRTSKTPKKSPKELASPKSHPTIHLNSSKIARKLLLSTDTVTLEDSKHENSLELDSSRTKSNISKRDKSPRKSSPNSKRRSSGSSGLSHRIRTKFSKSPKIVLKTPKSKKSKSLQKLTFPTKRYSLGGKVSQTPTKMSKTIPMPNTEPRKMAVTKMRKRSSEKLSNIGTPPKMKKLDSSGNSSSPNTSAKTRKLDGSENSARSSTSTKISKLDRTGNSSSPNTSTNTRKLDTMTNSPNALTTNSLIQSPLLWNAMTLKQPVVMLHRLPLFNDTSLPKNSSLLRVKEMTQTGLHSPIISAAKLSPIEQTLKGTQRGSASKPSTQTPQRLHVKPTSKNVSVLKVEPSTAYTSTPAKDTNKSEPLMSSTPHERMKRLAQLNTLDSPSKTPQWKSPWGKMNNSSPTSGVKSLIENIPEPSLCLTDIMQSRSASDIDISTKENKEGTYELIEPKTPNLREKSRKRTSQGENLESTRNAKKNFKVRFAIPNSSVEVNASTSNASVQRENKIHDVKAHTSKSTNPIRKNLFDSGNSRKKTTTSLLARSNSVSNGSVTKSSATKKSRRSNSFPNEDAAGFSSYGASATTTGSATKNSATKKPPNFAKIHQKMFSKLESVVDANKRVQERHTELTTANLSTSKTSSSKTVSVKEATNGPYNRFGFKLRKKEATDLMQKTQLHTRKVQQQKNRDILKGVRMNRRFELQMKARNMK